MEGHSRIGDWTGVELLAVNHGHCTGQVYPFLGTVTHYHQFFQNVVTFHDDGKGHGLRAREVQHLVGHSHEGNGNPGRESDIAYGEGSVIVRNCILAGSGNLYGSPYEGLAVSVRHHTADAALRLCQRRNEQHEECQKYIPQEVCFRHVFH